MSVLIQRACNEAHDELCSGVMTFSSFETVFGAQNSLGYVETPQEVVDIMIDKLFRHSPPQRTSKILDPGCGSGAFIDGVIRWCHAHSVEIPDIVGIESDAGRAHAARHRFEDVKEVEIRQGNFLIPQSDRFDFVVGNPPYVPISAISPAFRAIYRQNYTSASGRFDLYILFFEQALSLLKPGARLVFITPEKFLYVETGAPLRDLLTRVAIEELDFLDEETFRDLVTYPLVTTIVATAPGDTLVRQRNGVVRQVQLPRKAHSWLSTVMGVSSARGGPVLADICMRISCGVATGADSVFLVPNQQVPDNLRRFAHPTISGREIITAGILPSPRQSLLVPYDANGVLIPEGKLGVLREFLSATDRKAKLLKRTCVHRKPWYAFHETPPMKAIFRPKILCKDIGAAPIFVPDRDGSILPRHSVYYIVPALVEQLDALTDYLNSKPAQQWLVDNCQRAAKDFIRVQSHVLKHLPLPPSLAAADSAFALPVDRLSA